MRIPLYFCPDFTPWKETPKFQQAQWLLHDLVKNKHHDFPCDCGACIYAAYQKAKKVKGGSFSKRTFFIFFLRYGFLRSAYFDKRLKKSHFFGSRFEMGKLSLIRTYSGPYSKRADRRTRDERRKKGEEFFTSADIYIEKMNEIARRRTLSMIKKLMENEKGRHAKAFLRGILNKKCFYEYYKRAGDPKLESIVSKIRYDFLPNQGRFTK